MDTSKLKKFAQFARRALITQVSAKLESVVAENSAARREHPNAMRKLEAVIAKDGKDQVVERVAYTWFNRFSALRFMDLNELNQVRVVSPVSGQFQPEILAEAKAGHMDEGRVPDRVREQVRGLLDGRTPSPDAQTEAYRLLIVTICNDSRKRLQESLAVLPACQQVPTRLCRKGDPFHVVCFDRASARKALKSQPSP